MKPWSSLPPNMSTTARGFFARISSRTWVNQLKTSGRSSPLAMRPSICRRGDRAVSRRRAKERLARDDDERVAGDPDAELPLRREPLALRRRGGVVTGSSARARAHATAVSISSSSDRPSTALSARRGRSSRRAPLTLSSGPVRRARRRASSPRAGSSRTCGARARSGARDRGARRARRRSPTRPSAGAGLPPRSAAGAFVWVSRASPSELEVDERCHALGPHGVGDEKRERENGRLRRDREAREPGHDRSGKRRGRYCEPIPTAIAARTPPVTSGDGSPQAVKSRAMRSHASANESERKKIHAKQTTWKVTKRCQARRPRVHGRSTNPGRSRHQRSATSAVPWIAPQAMNVQPAPCQSPPISIVSMRLR